MKLRLLAGLGLLLCVFCAAAGGRAAMRKQMEMSMLVTGSIDIGSDGSVSAHAVDQSAKIPPGVLRLIGHAVPQWRFEPILVDGKAVPARARMGVRVVARQQDDGTYTLGIRSASFGEEGGVEGESVTAARMTPPHYPVAAAASNVSGTVYLVLKIGRAGAVEDVVEEQVNLTVLGTEMQMQQARRLLANAAKGAAREWEFRVPTRGEQADDPFWLARVPVEFALLDGPGNSRRDRAAYGSWQAYIPGPRTEAPWARDASGTQAPDAMVAGGLYPAGSGPRLLTPLTQG